MFKISRLLLVQRFKTWAPICSFGVPTQPYKISTISLNCIHKNIQQFRAMELKNQRYRKSQSRFIDSPSSNGSKFFAMTFPYKGRYFQRKDNFFNLRKYLATYAPPAVTASGQFYPVLSYKQHTRSDVTHPIGCQNLHEKQFSKNTSFYPTKTPFSAKNLAKMTRLRPEGKFHA